MKYDIKQILFRSFLMLLIVATLLGTFFRVRYGVDVTDDSFWVADPYLVTQGAVPMSDMWSQTPLTMLLIAPFIAMYTMLTGNTAGIVLYIGYVRVFFQLAVSAGVWLLLKRRMGWQISAVCALMLFSCSAGITRTLNYNVLSVYLLVLAGAFLYNGFSQETVQKAACRYAGAGIVMALCALAHSTQLVNCALFVIILFFVERRKYRSIPLWLIYPIAGLIVAFFTTLGLELAGEGTVVSGLSVLLQENNFFQIPIMTWYEQAVRTWGDIKVYIIKRLIPLAVVFFAAFSVSSLLKKHSMKAYVPRHLMYAVLCASGVVLLWFALRRGDSFSGDMAVFTLYVTVPVYLLWIKAEDRREVGPLFLFFWLPCLGSLLPLAMASYTPMNYRYYVLSFGAILVIPMACKAMEKTVRRSESDRESGAESVRFLILLLIGALFCAAMMTKIWTNVYRDDPIPSLTYCVEEGVYQGCYTSPERGAALEALERSIAAHVEEGESVFFSDLFPAGYMMVDAEGLTPTSWDACRYRDGFQDMDLAGAYFEHKGRLPDKIFFVNSEGNPQSIDDPQNQWAEFVLEHYTMVLEEGEGLFSYRLYELNQQ